MNQRNHYEEYGDRRALREIAPGVACLPQSIVNLYFVGERGVDDRGWTLIDTGLPGTARGIARAADRYYEGARPAAIVMTHGHFDHIGGLRELASWWDVPVYVHPLEIPYLTGRSPYPPPEPAVGGGAMARLSGLYPRGPVDLDGRVQPLPADGSVPTMPGWRWIHTPGHSPGHVSLFRDADRVLIAGDAFVTTKQESAIAALTKPATVHRPPAYFTPDWSAAGRSVASLAALEPELAATGHGIPLGGAAMRQDLHALAQQFDRLAIPRHGRYVDAPAVMDGRGVVAVPPPTAASSRLPAAIAGVGLLLAFLALRQRNSGR